MAFIGNKEIEKHSNISATQVEVKVKDGEPFVIHKDIYDGIVTDELGEGTITDNVNNYFARKFLAELAHYDLDFYFSKQIGMKLEILAHNLREQKIAEKFDAVTSDSIKLSKILDE
jgi:hypothetical protein